MKKIVLALLAVGLVGYSTAQDVLLSQDWQGFANGGDIPFVEEVDDADAEDWLSLDLDNLGDGSGQDPARPGNWYGSTDFTYGVETEIVGDTNFIMASSSWMDGFTPGNRNMLITPELEIPSTGYVFTWSSAPFQTPRYADGYSVLVSPGGDILDPEADFSDLIFQAAQMVEETSWNVDFYGSAYTGCSAAGGLEPSTFCWYPETYGDGTNGTAYRHGEDHTNMDVLLENGTSWVGRQEYHSIDLSAYAGQTIRLAFLHNSDDDNLISVDNIEVSLFTSVEDYAFEDMVNFYPNPATDVLNLNFTSFVKEQAIVNVYDASGRLVATETFTGAQLGAFQTINVADFATGVYSIQVNIDNKGVTGKTFMKK